MSSGEETPGWRTDGVRVIPADALWAAVIAAVRRYVDAGFGEGYAQ